VEFENNIVGTAIPAGYIPACEKGFREACNSGALIGFPVEVRSTAIWHIEISEVEVRQRYQLQPGMTVRVFRGQPSVAVPRATASSSTIEGKCAALCTSGIWYRASGSVRGIP